MSPNTDVLVVRRGIPDDSVVINNHSHSATTPFLRFLVVGHSPSSVAMC